METRVRTRKADLSGTLHRSLSPGGADWEYNQRLDEVIFAAYGWASDLSDEEILEKLLALNLERSKAAGG